MKEGTITSNEVLADPSSSGGGLAGLSALPPRPSTAEQAAAVLRDQIAAGRLLPGTRLREEQLAESLAISRNTVRETFRLLAHERLVEHVAYRGVRIRRIGPADIDALFRTRRLVEPLGIDAVLADAAERRTLRAIVEAATAAAERGDWQQVGTGDIDFHRAIVDACHSVHLSEMFEKLLAELRLAFLQRADPEELHRPYLERNRRLIDLLDAGDLAAAREELGEYLDAAERDVLHGFAA
jgi:DNA-binding GntR family transcriptional regulator